MARVVARLDRNEELAFLSIWDDEAKQFVDAIPPDERLAGWHLVLTDGVRLAAGPGAIVVLEGLWWTRWLGKLCRWLRLGAALGAIDGFVAKKKGGRLGRRVPDGPAPRRFP